MLKAVYDKFFAMPAMAKGIIIGLAFGFLFGGCVCRTWRQAVIEGPAPDDTYSFGWRDEPDYVARVVGTFHRPFFGDAAKNLILADEEKDAFLWKAYEQVTGQPWKAHDQNGTGCCVGEGFSAAVEILTCVHIAIDGQHHDYKPISAAAVYALSREVGDFLGNQDGSTGADAAKSLQTMGCISCEEAQDTNGVDGTAKPHAALAKKWGRTGLPADLKALALKHKVKTVSRVRTPEEVRVAITNGYPVPICSSVGFEPFKRDANGFCKPGGSWPHCMCIVGYRKDMKAFLVLQSWGPSMPPGPTSLGQPEGSFWIDWKACQRIVTTGECYALSSFDGYPKQDVPLFIRKPERQKNLFALVDLAW